MKPSIFDIVQDTEQCAEYFRAQRWPDGVRCPRCQSTRVRIRKTRPDGLRWYQCRDCLKGFSDTTGTVLEHSHVPLPRWFAIAFLLRRNLPDVQIAQDMGIEENTARRLGRLIRASTFFRSARAALAEPGGGR
jgi:transposase-like protein